MTEGINVYTFNDRDQSMPISIASLHDSITEYSVVGAHNSISGQVTRIGNIIAGEVPISAQNGLLAFSNGDQFVFDSMLNNNLDIISTNILFERIKDYEQKYKKTSEGFYENWIKGEVITTPEIYTWMTTYKTLFKPH